MWEETHFSEEMSGPALEHAYLGMDQMSESSQMSYVEALSMPSVWWERV